MKRMKSKRIKPMSSVVLALSLILLLLLLPATAAAQQNKFEDARERSADAARIIELVTLVSEGGIPKELVDKAEAVGVFPRVERETAFITQATLGYGVISARTESGWTLPAFYVFGGSGYGNPFAKDERYGVILLFMTKDAVAAFEKGGVKLANEKKALAGPVGAVTDEQRKEIEGAHILAYAYFNGKLKGTTYGKSFWKSFALNPDNNINKPLYGMKGREVLTGKQVNATSLPTEIPAYQTALQKFYAAKK